MRNVDAEKLDGLINNLKKEFVKHKGFDENHRVEGLVQSKSFHINICHAYGIQQAIDVLERAFPIVIPSSIYSGIG